MTSVFVRNEKEVDGMLKVAVGTYLQRNQFSIFVSQNAHRNVFVLAFEFGTSFTVRLKVGPRTKV